jgi:hypothetical protein
MEVPVSGHIHADAESIKLNTGKHVDKPTRKDGFSFSE